MKTLSVVIPSRNGFLLLEKFLPAIIRETRKAHGEIIVVDDCSDHSTVAEITRLFPEVIVLSRKQDPGFCHAVNMGMSRASGRYLMVLNNDIIPGENSFSKMVATLDESHRKVAVVVPEIIRPDNSDDSNYRWAFRHGLAVTGESIPGEEYPSGACALWKRSVWEELNGFSGDYAPIYWEDTDLGVRMHKAGYTMKKCSVASVKHMHGATMGVLQSSEALRERNRFVFMDNHCKSPSEKISRALWLPLHLFIAVVKKNKAFINGYRSYTQLRRDNK